MKIRGGSAGESVPDAAGRDRIAASLLSEGPATVSMLARRLGISGTAVRRHLEALGAAGWVESTDRPPYGPMPSRGRGRPARTFSLTEVGRAQFRADYDSLACEALAFVDEIGGDAAVQAFATQRAEGLERRIREHVEAALGRQWESADPEVRVRAVAAALSDLGYATSVDPAFGGVQVCQHHCPVAHVAARFPALCDAETDLLGRLLGHHVQRLATIAHGDGVCTTVIPLTDASGHEVPTHTRERTSA